jgi:hypothetical protein
LTSKSAKQCYITFNNDKPFFININMKQHYVRTQI